MVKLEPLYEKMELIVWISKAKEKSEAAECRDNCSLWFLWAIFVTMSGNKWTNCTAPESLHLFVCRTHIEQMKVHGCSTSRGHFSNVVRTNTAASWRLRRSKVDVDTNMAFWKTKPLLISLRHFGLTHLSLVNEFKDSFIKHLQTHRGGSWALQQFYMTPG